MILLTVILYLRNTLHKREDDMNSVSLSFDQSLILFRLTLYVHTKKMTSFMHKFTQNRAPFVGLRVLLHVA